MPVFPLLLLFLLILLPAQAVGAEPSRETMQARVEEKVARCHGDKTCESVVRKRETATMERELRDRALRESDPWGYYLTLYRRYLFFVFAVCGSVALYIFLMRRWFGARR